MTQPETWESLRLRALRKKSGLTQKQLADKSGVDRSRLNRLENAAATLTPYYAEKLAPALNVNAAELQRPTGDGDDPVDPLARLEELSTKLADALEQQAKDRRALGRLQDRVRRLEAPREDDEDAPKSPREAAA